MAEAPNGRPPFDPSRNVLDLVEAANKRSDDLAAEREKTWQAEFKRVDDKFDTAERQRLENKVDSRTAVDAALAAAKELVIAQATTAKESMQQQASANAALLKGLADSLSDLKDRIVAIEANKAGSESQRTDQRQNIGAVVGVAGVALALLMAAITVAMLIANGNGAG